MERKYWKIIHSFSPACIRRFEDKRGRAYIIELYFLHLLRTVHVTFYGVFFSISI